MADTFLCEGCNKSFNHAILDGGAWIDRILAGVDFVCAYSPQSGWIIGITRECEDQFDKLNKSRWLKEVAEYCKDNDMWECPECGYDMLRKIENTPVSEMKQFNVGDEVTIDGVAEPGYVVDNGTCAFIAVKVPDLNWASFYSADGYNVVFDHTGKPIPQGTKPVLKLREFPK